jgi:hypothetical protein
MNKLTLRQLIREMIDEESEAAKKAKSMGLTDMGFGRWGKDGKVTHKSDGRSLTVIQSKGTTPQKDTSKKANSPTQTKSKTPTPIQAKPSISTPEPPQTTFSFNKEKGMSIYRAVDNSLQNAGFGGRDAFSKGFVPLVAKQASMRRFSRGDAAKYKDWMSVVPDTSYNKTQKVLEKDPEVTQKTLQHYIDSTGAKKIGQVKGEFGSSKYNDVYKKGDTLFVNRGNRVDIGSASRLRNPDVWDFKK